MGALLLIFTLLILNVSDSRRVAEANGHHVTQRSLRHGPQVHLEASTEGLGNTTRNPKFFPLFTLVRFSNEPCRTTNEENGICYTRPQCSALGGLAGGTCARGLGVCCQFFSTCGSIINQNQTFFRNPDYPNKYRPTSGSDVCQIRIRKQVNTCQLRLNFLRFDIDGPSPAASNTAGSTTAMEAGICKTDMLTISVQNAAPSICGNLDAQHMYLDFGASDSITLNILLSQTATRDREWSIEILMLPCRAEVRAPSGCLQYFQGISGQVQSFNFGGGMHLANLGYSVCVRIEEGMRNIDWSACSLGDVRMTGPAIPTVQPIPAACVQTNNPYEYFIIPGGVPYPLPTMLTPPLMIGQSSSDRFCDVSFGYANSFVRTNVKPFLLTIRTDGTELGTTGAAALDASGGFCLKWQQSPN